MIDEDDVELGAAEIGQSRGRGERQIAEFGVPIVDDIGRHFDRRLGGLTGGGGIAGERLQDADLHRIGGASGVAADDAAATPSAAKNNDDFFTFFLPLGVRL